MSDLVPPDDIERIVGTQRKHDYHVGRAVSAEQTVYILHSHDCRNSGRDLRECPFSVALDRGINERDWSGMEDGPVVLDITGRGDLVPAGRMIGVAR